MNTLSSKLTRLPQLNETPRNVLYILIFLHVIIIGLSNVAVQFPLEIPLLHVYNTWGAFSYPFIFLVTDLTVRLYGAMSARRIILFAMLPALLISYVVSLWFHKGSLTFADITWDFNLHIFRIALASFLAYIVGQAADIQIFQFVKQQSSVWWMPPACAAIFGAVIDTLIFFFIAFFRSSDTFMAEHWFSLSIADYFTKIIILAIFFLPLYGWLLGYFVNKIMKKSVE